MSNKENSSISTLAEYNKRFSVTNAQYTGYVTAHPSLRGACIEKESADALLVFHPSRPNYNLDSKTGQTWRPNPGPFFHQTQCLSKWKGIGRFLLKTFQINEVCVLKFYHFIFYVFAIKNYNYFPGETLNPKRNVTIFCTVA